MTLMKIIFIMSYKLKTFYIIYITFIECNIYIYTCYIIKYMYNKK